MADVRGATGVPAAGVFAGAQTPTPSTPLYVNLSNGDLYVLINETVTKVGSVVSNADLVIAQQSMDKHFVTPFNVADANATLAQRAFARFAQAAAAVIGEASDVLAQRSFSPRTYPANWG